MANGDHEDIENPAGAGNYGAFAGDVPNETAQKAFWINMHSAVFDRPIGLLFYIRDQRGLPYGAFYAEEAQIQSHNFALAAQGITISEQASLIFDRLVPVSVTSA